MSKTMVRNVSGGAITLPPPYTGIIPPGVSVIIDDDSNAVAAALFIVPETTNLLTVSSVSDANPTTIPVSRESAADTIATVTFASLTSPLDFNGQRGVNAGNPIDDQDLVTLQYFNTHGSGGGSGVTYGDLGEVVAPGGPYPGIPVGTPVSIIGGTVVLTDANDPATLPCAGVYMGALLNRIRTSGLISGLVGLPANVRLYAALGGGLTQTPPAGNGQVVQSIGTTVGTSKLFVALEDPTYL